MCCHFVHGFRDLWNTPNLSYNTVLSSKLFLCSDLSNIIIGLMINGKRTWTLNFTMYESWIVHVSRKLNPCLSKLWIFHIRHNSLNWHWFAWESCQEIDVQTKRSYLRNITVNTLRVNKEHCLHCIWCFMKSPKCG